MMNIRTLPEGKIYRPGNAKTLYELVLLPDEGTIEKIKQVRLDYPAEPGLDKSNFPEPLIRIVSVSIENEIESTLIRWLYRIISRQKTFTIQFNNYGVSLPDKIYLRILDPEPFREMKTSIHAIEGFIRTATSKGFYFDSRPHLILMDGLSAGSFEKAARWFSSEDFTESFRAEKLIFRKVYPGEPDSVHLSSFYFLP